MNLMQHLIAAGLVDAGAEAPDLLDEFSRFYYVQEKNHRQKYL